MHKITIKTKLREEIFDITPQVQKFITENRLLSGVVTIYSPHTTAAITINENADPSVKKDLNSFLTKAVPPEYPYAHREGNSDAHIKGSLINFSQNVIVEDGMLQLGTWQGIFFMEFDGPRERECWLKFIESP